MTDTQVGLQSSRWPWLAKMLAIPSTHWPFLLSNTLELSFCTWYGNSANLLRSCGSQSLIVGMTCPLAELHVDWWCSVFIYWPKSTGKSILSKSTGFQASIEQIHWIPSLYKDEEEHFALLRRNMDTSLKNGVERRHIEHNSAFCTRCYAWICPSQFFKT